MTATRSGAVPRRKIDELITRWHLTGLKVLVLEGPTDARFIRMVHDEGHWGAPFDDVDVVPTDAVEIPPDLVQAHGLNPGSARSRVIAFAKDIDEKLQDRGLCGAIDVDLDNALGKDWRSAALLYTDYGCMIGYAWTEAALRTLLLQYKCDGRGVSRSAVAELYLSLTECCAMLAAIRLVMYENAIPGLKVHRSQAALRMTDGKVSFDRDHYLQQCGISSDQREATREAVGKAERRIGATNGLYVMNSHDLVWLLGFALRELSSLPRRFISDELVESALMTIGASDARVPTQVLFSSLARWAAA